MWNFQKRLFYRTHFDNCFSQYNRYKFQALLSQSSHSEVLEEVIVVKAFWKYQGTNQRWSASSVKLRAHNKQKKFRLPVFKLIKRQKLNIYKRRLTAHKMSVDTHEVMLKIRKRILIRGVITFRSSRPEVFCKKDVLRNFAKFTGKYLCQGLFFNKFAYWGPQLYWTIDFGTGVSLWILCNFQEHFFLQNTSAGCFWTSLINKCIPVRWDWIELIWITTILLTSALHRYLVRSLIYVPLDQFKPLSRSWYLFCYQCLQ